jgi:hypothetical protein
VLAWDQQPAAIALNPAGEQGVDRLKLGFAIQANGDLSVAITDLATGANLGQRVLGCVR